ncbi:MAG: hypothetical protein ABIH99_01155 [Candidatus Micrarchaeota archaeon]
MEVEAIVKLKNIPGALISTLTPIAAHGGNVFSIAHAWDEAEGAIVPTSIKFEIADGALLNLILADLDKAKLTPLEVKIQGRRLFKRKSFSFAYVGHVLDTDANDTINKINATGAQVTSFNIKIVSPEGHSSAMFRADCEEEKYPSLCTFLSELAREKKLLMIREI